VDNAPRLPDLLSGSPVLAALRLRHEGGTLVVRGVTAHGTWVEQLDVPGTMPGDDLDAIPALWARETIEDLELDLACGGERKAIDRRIEDIGLRYTVSSRLTSWVAIAEEPTVDPRQPVRVERIPQALPYGMSAEGLGLGGAVSGIFSSVMEPSRSSGRVSFLRRPFSVADAHPRYPEMDRMAATVRAQFDRTRDLAMEQMARIEGLQHIFREIVKLTSESRSELFRPGVPPNEIEPLRRQLLDKLTDVEHALHKLQDPHLRVERLTADIEHLRHAVEDAIRRVTEQVALHGRVFPTPGRPTATLEIQVVSAFEWRPASTATVAERIVAIVEKGTTRPGLLVAGSLVHVELSADPKDIARAGEVEMRSGDDLLVIALGATN
jgi:hypothetical protein